MTPTRFLTSLGFVFVTLIAMAAFSAAAEPDVHRFFHSGDGRIDLVSAKRGLFFKGRYRTGEGHYDPAALKSIQEVFGARAGDPMETISLRLIEFLDYLEDHLKPGSRITVASGFRSPQYNRSLRDAGGIVAKASLHQYGMAADVKIAGISARHLWEFVKALGFGGAGYYHGDLVHIDVGPARFWDERTSGVDSGTSDDNKLIGLVSDYDYYLAAEALNLRFIRMTAFPIGVQPEFILERAGTAASWSAVAVFQPELAVTAPAECPRFEDIGQMALIRWRLPPDLAPGRYRVRARFCGQVREGMPPEVTTDAWEVIRP